MDQGIDKIIERFVSSVSKTQPGLVGAYLFGSYAKNNFRAESDIDIALVIDHLPDSEKFNTQVRLMLLATQFDSRIEPHPISKQDLMSSNNPFAAEIRRPELNLSCSNHPNIKYNTIVAAKLATPCKPVRIVCVRYVSRAEIPVNCDTTQNQASFVCDTTIAPLPTAMTTSVI